MIDFTRETVFSLSEVPNRLNVARRGGKRLAVSTAYRWAKGLRGIRLETLRIGGSLSTSAEALQRFFERLGEASGGGAAGPPRGLADDATSSRSRAIADADRELDRLGF